MCPAPRLAGIVPALVLTFDTAAGTLANGDGLPTSNSSLVATGFSGTTTLANSAGTDDPWDGNPATRRGTPATLGRIVTALAVAGPGLPTAYVWRRTHFTHPGIAIS